MTSKMIPSIIVGNSCFAYIDDELIEYDLGGYSMPRKWVKEKDKFWVPFSVDSDKRFNMHEGEAELIEKVHSRLFSMVFEDVCL